MFAQTHLALALAPTAYPLLLTVLGATLFFVGRRLTARRSPAEVPASSAIPAVQSSNSRLERVLRRAPVAVWVSDAEAAVHPFAGWVIDRTIEGLCVELAEEGEVAPGTILSVRPKEAADNLPWVRVEVRKCRVVDGGWELDCRYVKTPSYNVRVCFG